MANNSVTFRHRSPAYELISDVTIMKPGFKNIPSSEKLLTRALWDTGSDGCMIDETAASNLGLEVTGNIMIAGIHGTKGVLPLHKIRTAALQCHLQCPASGKLTFRASSRIIHSGFFFPIAVLRERFFQRLLPWIHTLHRILISNETARNSPSILMGVSYRSGFIRYRAPPAGYTSVTS